VNLLRCPGIGPDDGTNELTQKEGETMNTKRTAAEQSAVPDAGSDVRRTIAVARARTRFSRLKVEYPDRILNWIGTGILSPGATAP
jgi:hypothetical protein